MSESVEQAARADWKARAEREAAAILAETTGGRFPANYDGLVRVVAAAWLLGCNYGMHDALAGVEVSFAELVRS